MEESGHFDSGKKGYHQKRNLNKYHLRSTFQRGGTSAERNLLETPDYSPFGQNFKISTLLKKDTMQKHFLKESTMLKF